MGKQRVAGTVLYVSSHNDVFNLLALEIVQYSVLALQFWDGDSSVLFSSMLYSQPNPCVCSAGLHLAWMLNVSKPLFSLTKELHCRSQIIR